MKKHLIIVGVISGVGLLIVTLFLRSGKMPSVSTAVPSGFVSLLQEGGGVPSDTSGSPVRSGQGYAVVNGDKVPVGEAPVSPATPPVHAVEETKPPSSAPRALRATPSLRFPKIPTAEVIQSFSVFDVSPQLKSFREQMIKEGVIKADEFMKINNNTDMEQFLLKMVAWKAKGAGATNEQIQGSLASISNAYSRLRSAR